MSGGWLQVSCVSGAQLASYATFLSHPEHAPLSIVLTALSTAAGVFMTPLLALLLLGARIPVNAPQMAVSIFQIVLLPVAAVAHSSLSYKNCFLNSIPSFQRTSC